MANAKALLAVGDMKDFEAFRKFKRAAENFPGISFLSAGYGAVLSRKLPEINSKELVIFLFFPFEYWDRHIEPKYYKGVYGSGKFFRRFESVCKRIEKNLSHAYKGKKIHYIIPPSLMHLDRDKEITKELLRKHGIPVPKTIKSRNVSEIKRIAQKSPLYIKVRYGAMGKGITRLSRDSWTTNFRFRNGKIKSRKSDYGWTFIDITGNDKFLKELLKQDIIIEEEVAPYVIGNRKFDLRVYASYGKARYIYPRTNHSSAVTTNISQGGRGENRAFLRKIPKKMLDSAARTAVKAAKAMNSHIAGVDIMFDRKTKKPMVIEVNVFPGFPSSKGFNLSKRILSDIKEGAKINSIQIRKAAQKDLNRVLELKLESKQEEMSLNKELLPVNSVKKDYSEYLRRDIEGKYRTVILAMAGSRPAGMVVGRIYRSLKVAGYKRSASMGGLYVKKGLRKQGIAGMLIKEFIRWAKSRNVRRITLSVYRQNRHVQEMFHKNGFRTKFVSMQKKL